MAYRYYVVAGHRRIAAAKALQMPELVCACLPHKEDPEIAAREDLLLAMVENLSGDAQSQQQIQALFKVAA